MLQPVVSGGPALLSPQYFSLPTPSEDTGVEPRHSARLFDVPGNSAHYTSNGRHSWASTARPRPACPPNVCLGL